MTLTRNDRLDSEIDEGEIVVLTSGDFSNFELVSIVKVLKSFNHRALMSHYLLQNPDKRTSSNASPYVLWLVENGYVEELSYPKILKVCSENGYIIDSDRDWFSRELEQFDPRG